MDDQFALVEKVVKDVNHILRSEPELCSFEIVPVDTNHQNRSPILHHGVYLGLESWCVKHLYMSCYSELIDSGPRPKKKNKTLLDCDKLIRLLNVTLLINPDLSTLWNKRRELVLKGRLDRSSELHYVTIVLSRKPKCNEAFTYRRWIWEALMHDSSFTGSEQFVQVLADEFRVCARAADKSVSNYHAWSHRIWLVRSLKASGMLQRQLLHVYCDEYSFSEDWSMAHISDHSCFQYRQFCLKNIYKLQDIQWKEFKKYSNYDLRRIVAKMISQNLPDATAESEVEILKKSDENFMHIFLGESLKTCNCFPKYTFLRNYLEIMFYELHLNNGVIQIFKNHETLWYHRRFIIHEILSAIYEYHGISRGNVKTGKNSCATCHADFSENKAKIVRYDSECIFLSLLFLVLLNCDRKVTTERKMLGDNYADRHEKYLKFIEGVCL